MKKLAALAALLVLAACGTMGGQTGGPRMNWRCSGGAAFSARINTNGAEVFAGGQVYNLLHVAGASGARYSNGSVEYWERGGEATLSGARGGPYNSCRRG